MIRVTRLNRSVIALNSDLIQDIEATPDTVISLTTGQKITVLETEEEIIERVWSWRRSLVSDHSPAAGPGASRWDKA